jgi:hypothetical protein
MSDHNFVNKRQYVAIDIMSVIAKLRIVRNEKRVRPMFEAALTFDAIGGNDPETQMTISLWVYKVSFILSYLI